jgi:glycosyltransferase involved in cell wall biosynthesis
MTVRVVVPGTEGRWWCGGLLIALRAAELLDDHVPTEVVTSHDVSEGHRALDEALADADPADLFVVTWGPHVQELLERLRGRRVVYYAQSPGWGITVPPGVAVVTLSRFLLAYWAERAPHQPVNLLPPVLDPRCVDPGGARDIDVLFLSRKSTPYLAERLVPALAEQCRVHVQDETIDRGDLIGLYQRARIYVYSSAPADYGTAAGSGTWLEGFGLQPLEALACGCAVFSNVHGGLADYLEPDVNAWKLETHSLAHDVGRVLAAVRGDRTPAVDAPGLRTTYSEAAFHERVARLLPAWEEYFAAVEAGPGDFGPGPGPRRRGRRWALRR